MSICAMKLPHCSHKLYYDPQCRIKLHFISVEIHSTLKHLITTEEIIALYTVTYT